MAPFVMPIGGELPGGTNAEVGYGIDVDGDVSVLPDLGRPRHGLGAAVVNRSAYALLGGDQPGLFVQPDGRVTGAALADARQHRYAITGCHASQ